MSGSIIFTVEKGDKAARHLLLGKFSTHGCVVGPHPLGPNGGHCFRHIEGRVVFSSYSFGAKKVSDGIVKLIPKAQRIITAIGGPIEVCFEWRAKARPETYMAEWRVPSTQTWIGFNDPYTKGLLASYKARCKLMRQAKSFQQARTNQQRVVSLHSSR